MLLFAKRLATLRCVLVVFLLGALQMAYAQPYSAGLRSFKLNRHGSTMPVLMWFPAQGVEALMPSGPYTPNVVQSAAVLPGKWPLVVISHGTGSNSLGHHTQAEALARAGFIVAAPEHLGDNFRDRNLVADPRFWQERPAQISALLDAPLADDAWAKHIDASRIGALGHSAGGHTVLALAGMPFDLRASARHCSIATDDPSCALRDPKQFIEAAPASGYALPVNAAPPQVGPLVMKDDRVGAAMAMAPAAHALVPSPGSALGIAAKVLIIAAENDQLLPMQHHAAKVRRLLGDAAQWEIAPGTGHFSFMAPITAEWQERLAYISKDPEGLNRVQFQAKLSAQTVRYFEEALRAGASKL